MKTNVDEIRFLREEELTITAVQSSPELASWCNNELTLGWDDDAEAGKRGDRCCKVSN